MGRAAAVWLLMLGCSLDDNSSLYANQEEARERAELLTGAFQADGTRQIPAELEVAEDGPTIASVLMPLAIPPGSPFELAVTPSPGITAETLVIEFDAATSAVEVPLTQRGDAWVTSAAFALPTEFETSTIVHLHLRAEDGRLGPATQMDIHLRPQPLDGQNITAQLLSDASTLTGAVRFVDMDGSSRLLVGGLEVEGNLTRGRVSIWDLERGVPLSSLTGHTGQITSMAFDDATGTLATASVDQTIRVWDLENQTLIQTLGHHGDEVHAVRFSPDAQHLVSGGWDERLHVHQTSDWSEVYRSEPLGPIAAIAASPTTDTVAIATGRIFGTGELLLYSVTTETMMLPEVAHRLTWDDPVTAIAYESGGERIAAAVGLGTLVVVDTRSGEILTTLNPPCTGLACIEQSKQLGADGIDAPQDFITGLAFSGAAGIGASTISGVIGRWDLTTGTMQAAFALPTAIPVAAFSADYGQIALGAADGRPRIISLPTPPFP